MAKETEIARRVEGIPEHVRMPDNSAYTNRFQVRSESSGSLYTIAQSKSGRWWSCSCPSWIRRKRCKHLDALGLPGNHEPYEPRRLHYGG